MAGLPTRPARSLSTLHRPRYRGPRMTRSQCGWEKLLGDAGCPTPQCALSALVLRFQRADCHCNTPRQRLCGHPDHRRLHAAVPGRERETTPLSTVRGRHAIRQAITSASGWSRSAAKSSVPGWLCVASATMYSALRVNCKARRAMTCTAARRSAARLKTW